MNAINDVVQISRSFITESSLKDITVPSKNYCPRSAHDLSRWIKIILGYVFLLRLLCLRMDPVYFQCRVFMFPF